MELGNKRIDEFPGKKGDYETRFLERNQVQVFLAAQKWPAMSWKDFTPQNLRILKLGISMLHSEEVNGHESWVTCGWFVFSLFGCYFVFFSIFDVFQELRHVLNTVTALAAASSMSTSNLTCVEVARNMEDTLQGLRSKRLDLQGWKRVNKNGNNFDEMLTILW